ncbi:MAG: group 1 truncated hemoglobin [Alcanivoracaceae bacterium]|jgi:hemoglobin|nr:group 1 truncated hemoglobin [Alcanivoracaceae bacterium]
MIRLATLILIASTSLAACQSNPHPSLFRDLGGLDGIGHIVDEFMLGLGNDPRIAHHFGQTDPQRFRQKLIEQFCAESGGGCSYSGESMRDAHAGRNISHADFNALVEVLIDAMDKQDIPVAAQNRLLQRLAPMHQDVVTH